MNKWATVGVDTETGIDTPLTGGSKLRPVSPTGTPKPTSSPFLATLPWLRYVLVQRHANHHHCQPIVCTTNGWYYFYRSITTDRCTSAYYMIYGSTSSYRWSGFALAAGYYGRQANTGDITYKVGNVAPRLTRSSLR